MGIIGGLYEDVCLQIQMQEINLVYLYKDKQNVVYRIDYGLRNQIEKRIIVYKVRIMKIIYL